VAWFRRTSGKKTETLAETKPEIWVRCSACKAHIFKEEWDQTIRVCPKCNHHERLTAQERIDLLIDAGTFIRREAEIAANDPLVFEGGGWSFAEKMADTLEKTEMPEAALSGRGKILGDDAAIVVMDFRFLGGSLGTGTGEIILQAILRAIRRKIPLIIVSASGGARMQEGMFSLMQMAKTCAGIAKLNQAGLPYLSILTDPTMGGVSASYAMMGDVNIAEPSALIGFAGRRVIEHTIKQKLPPGFQTAEYLLEHGFVDLIVPRAEMKQQVSRILKYSLAGRRGK
jgi:acetyl-CoA carboxylase carboxyl transferase subunit beta